MSYIFYHDFKKIVSTEKYTNLCEVVRKPTKPESEPVIWARCYQSWPMPLTRGQTPYCTKCGKNVKTCISIFNHILYNSNTKHIIFMCEEYCDYYISKLLKRDKLDYKTSPPPSALFQNHWCGRQICPSLSSFINNSTVSFSLTQPRQLKGHAVSLP